MRILSGVITGFLSLALPAIAEPLSAEDEISNGLTVVQPPRPKYPAEAAKAGIVGRCLLHFSVYEYGQIVEIEESSCTHPVFCEASETAVHEAQFIVVDVEGTPKPGVRTDIQYPFEYWLPGAPEWLEIQLRHAPSYDCKKSRLTS